MVLANGLRGRAGVERPWASVSEPGPSVARIEHLLCASLTLGTHVGRWPGVAALMAVWCRELGRHGGQGRAVWAIICREQGCVCVCVSVSGCTGVSMCARETTLG